MSDLKIYICFMRDHEKKNGDVEEVEVYRDRLPAFYLPMRGTAQRDLASIYERACAIAEDRNSRTEEQQQ